MDVEGSPLILERKAIGQVEEENASQTTVDGSARLDARQDRSRIPLNLFTVLAVLAPGFIVFALPAVTLIARNSEYFGGDYSAGRLLFALAAISIATGFALWVLSATTAGRFLFCSYLLTAPAWFLYTMLLDWRRAVAGLVVVVAVLVGGYFLARSRRSAIVNVGVVGALLLIGSVVTTIIAVQPAAEAAASVEVSSSTSPSVSSSSLPNVYHIVFDEFQTEMLEIALDADLERALAGFTFYPDARTEWGRTQMSMASIFGQASYDYETTPQDYVDESLRGPSSGLEHLRRAGYQITAYTISEAVYGSPQPFDQTVLFKDLIQSDPGSNYEQLATSFWAYSNLPGSLAKRLMPADDYDQLGGQNLLPDDAPPVSAEGFRTFINRERQLPETGRYSIVHLLLPHFPYVLSADCGYEAGTETTPEAQAGCAANLIEDLLEELRELDRFTGSTIIIQGDHGARFDSSEDGTLLALPSDYYGERWSEARSRSVLLVKTAGVNSSASLVVSDYPAQLTDVMPTIFDSVGLSFESSETRTSLLDSPLPDRDVRVYHFYDKGGDNLPDGEVTRFLIVDGVMIPDGTITVPMP